MAPASNNSSTGPLPQEESIPTGKLGEQDWLQISVPAMQPLSSNSNSILHPTPSQRPNPPVSPSHIWRIPMSEQMGGLLGTYLQPSNSNPTQWLMGPNQTAFALSDTPVEEWIGGWNVHITRYTEVEYVAVKTKYFIVVSYSSRFCLVNVQALAVYLANAPFQLSWEGILGKPKEEIGNLNGFEYRYLINLKVPYFLYLSSVSIKFISMGTTLFLSMARLALP